MPLKASWFYVSSLSGKNWQKNLKATFAAAKKSGSKIAWNPGNRQLQAGHKVLSGYLKQTDVLILNKDEAIELVLSGVKLGRKNPNFLNKPVYLLNILQEWGPKIVVLTAGQKGAWVYDSRKIFRQPIKKAKVINTTGIGDCFGSSFIAGLILEKNITKALKWAMINCASAVGQVGAQAGLLARKELMKKIN